MVGTLVKSDLIYGLAFATTSSATNQVFKKPAGFYIPHGPRKALKFKFEFAEPSKTTFFFCF